VQNAQAKVTVEVIRESVTPHLGFGRAFNGLYVRERFRDVLGTGRLRRPTTDGGPSLELTKNDSEQNRHTFRLPQNAVRQLNFPCYCSNDKKHRLRLKTRRNLNF